MITTVVGSYPRIGPGLKAPSVRTAIARLDRGEVSAQELRKVEDEVTAETIQEQVDAGLDLVTDGQVRWDDGQTYFAARLDGFKLGGLVRYFDTNTYYRQPVAVGKVAWREPIAVSDFEFARAHSPRPVKPVVTGPYTLAALSQPGAYPSVEALTMDLAEALNQEARALQTAGATIIQFDEPAILRSKGDFALFRRAMGVLMAGLSIETALYTYFGDILGLEGQYFDLPFRVFGLDFVQGRRNFEAVRHLPADRTLGFGIADARNTRLETVEGIRASFERISASVDSDRVHLSPSAGLEFLPRETARAKIRRLAEAASAING